MERREKNRERNMGLLPVLHKQSLGAVGLGRRAVQSSAWVGALPHPSSQPPTHLSGPSCPTWCLPKSLMASAWISM